MLTLKAWLDEERGRYTALAAHLGVSVGRVSQMADDGVPVKFMAQVRDFTQDAVSLEALVAARTPGAPAEAVASDHPKGASKAQRERDGDRSAKSKDRTPADRRRSARADKPSHQRKGR